METSDWPPSNYPIFFALVLLAATAVTLAMGDETRAEELAIYAYYLLVIGVTIRFFEISLPDDTPERIKSVKFRILKLTGGFTHWMIKHTSNTASIIVCKIEPLRRFIQGLEFKSRISSMITKSHLMRISIKPNIQKPTYKPHIKPYMDRLAKMWVNRNTLMYIHEISKDVSLYLFLIFLLLSAYGSIFGWWIIRGYIDNLALVLIGSFAVYLLSSIILKQSDKD